MPYADLEKRREYNNEYNKKWCQKNKERRAQIQKKSYLKNKEAVYKSQKISNWKASGIIDEDLESVFNVYINETDCWICLKKFKNSLDRCLDHDHKTGEIRYICCRNCNGNFLREDRL